MVSSDGSINQWRVPPNKLIRLKDFDPDWSGDPDLTKAERKQFAENVLSQDVSKLAEAQDRLYAADRWSILIILQAMDAAGKDSTIKHVMSGINPQGCQVFGFKHPSGEDLDHNFLWRYSWHIIPANHRWVSRALVARFITSAIDSLDVQYPEVTDEQRNEIAKAKKQLEAEKDD